MQQSDSNPLLERRKALLLGAVATGTLIGASRAIRPARAEDSDAGLPVKQIEKILGASGNVSSGVLSVEIDRDDLHAELPGGIPVLPSNQLNGTLYFQTVRDDEAGPHTAILNGDFCLKPDETNPFIDALIKNGLTVQAFHQHLFDLKPIFWFVHFRGVGHPLKLARAARDAINVTSTPLPQSAPANPTSPIDANKIAEILGGSATIGNNGVVSVDVERNESFTLGGYHISPALGIITQIEFQPLDSAGRQALVIPDFALLGREVDNVFKRMREQGFRIGCLYNQETDEKPQLYFSHMWRVGNPYDLAREIRHGLDLTNSQHD